MAAPVSPASASPLVATLTLHVFSPALIAQNMRKRNAFDEDADDMDDY